MFVRYVLLSLLLAPAYAYGEPINISALTLQGNNTKLPNIPQGIMVQALLVNNSDMEQDLVYIVQVKDSNDHTVKISWMNETIRPRGAYVATQPLALEIHDLYTVEIFVWDSIEAPIPLSYGHNLITFDASKPLCIGASDCFEGAVTRIIDGDTIDVDGKRIRLALVDTPERGESGYVEATRFTSTLCPVGSTVLVDQDDKQLYDRFNRMIAVVYCDGVLLNAELLFSGHAVIMKGFCRASEFGEEEWAKQFGC